MNVSSRKLRCVWLAPLTQELVNRSTSVSPSILDYGCGYFDLASLLPVSFQVDGFDFDERLIASIKPRAHSLLSSSLEDFESKKYDFIVLNSVLQYFESPSDFSDFLNFSKRHLKPNGEIILSDLIPHQYNPIKDAFLSIVLSARNFTLLSMLVHLFKRLLFRSVKHLWKVSEDEISLFANNAHFDFIKLDKNLTPSTYRWSSVLKPRLLKDTDN